MSFKETFEKINSSSEFKDFIKENPSAELCAGFFIIDLFGNDNKNSLDYKLEDKIFTFELREDNSVKMIQDKLIETPENRRFPKLEKISSEIKIELDGLKSIAGIKALNEGISSKFNKIIAVLQNYNNKQTWNLTCMLEGLIILHILIDAETGEIIKFERKSMMDMIRKK